MENTINGYEYLRDSGDVRHSPVSNSRGIILEVDPRGWPKGTDQWVAQGGAA